MSAADMVVVIVGPVAVIYGGGQIPSANLIIGMIIAKLLQLDCEVYGVHRSFLGMSDISFYEKVTLDNAKEIQKQIGTYLSMCRKFDPADKKNYNQIIAVLRELGIHKLIVPGGDGSSRAMSDLVKRARKVGYPLQVIFVPCTIDGIAGSTQTVGYNPAVAESFRHALFMIPNAFATWNPKFATPRIPIIEIQGRNRNDIAVGVMREISKAGSIGKYSLDDFDLIFIPAAYKWSINDLLDRIYLEDRETAIVVAEGAAPTEEYWGAIKGDGVGEKLKNIITSGKKRECNLDVVGYLSQTNDCISEEEIHLIDEWTDFAIKTMAKTDKSLAIIKNGDKFSTKSIHTFAKATNSKDAIPLTEAELAEFSKNLL